MLCVWAVGVEIDLPYSCVESAAGGGELADFECSVYSAVSESVEYWLVVLD